jgi:hypothetical protein
MSISQVSETLFILAIPFFLKYALTKCFARVVFPQPWRPVRKICGGLSITLFRISIAPR